MNLSEMTGLQILQAIADGSVPPPRMNQIMPIQLISIKKGEIIFETTADDRHLNPQGSVHGGFAATMLDSVTGSAVHSVLAAGIGYNTVGLNLKLCRPLPRDKTLTVIGNVIKISKNLVTTEGRIIDRTGKLYAHATSTCMIIHPSQIG